MKTQPPLTTKGKTIGHPVAFLMATVFLTLHWSNISAAQPAEVKLARPTPEQAAWQDMELGLFIHYDIPVFKPGWDHRQYEKRPEPDLFNPRKLNTDQWMEAAKAMGANTPSWSPNTVVGSCAGRAIFTPTV